MILLYSDEMNLNFTEEFFMKISSAVFEKTGVSVNKNCELSLLITDDINIQELNKNYRLIDKPTDVLSFPMEEEDMLGDIAISAETAKRQAEENEVTFETEISFLFIHGLLHLLGYDHETNKEDEREMFSLQEEILYNLINSGEIK